MTIIGASNITMYFLMFVLDICATCLFSCFLQLPEDTQFVTLNKLRMYFTFFAPAGT